MAENNKKNKTAIALTYNPDEPAPKIIATGKGYLADKIVKSADENKIPVHKDEKLAGTLSKLDIGDYIPPQLYEVVAEILLFVDNMDRIKGKLTKENISPGKLTKENISPGKLTKENIPPRKLSHENISNGKTIKNEK